MQKNHKIKMIVAAACVVILLCVLMIVTAGYWQLSSLFHSDVAVVTPDEQDLAEVTAVQQQEKPVLTLPEEEAAIATSVADLNLKGVSAQAVTSIPTAIYAQEPIDEAVENVLLVLDQRFYVLSKQGEDFQLFCVNPSVLVPIQGYGWTTLAQGYEMGGLPCVVNTLNQVMELDITHFVFANSESLWYISDQMGGLTVTLSAKEAAELNRLLGTAYTAGETVMWTGGLQAYTTLTVDGDAITHWQHICNAVIDKAKQEKRTSQLVKAISSNVSTNLSLPALREIGEMLLQTQTITQHDFPQDGTYKLLDGQPVLDADLAANRKIVHYLIYQ